MIKRLCEIMTVNGMRFGSMFKAIIDAVFILKRLQ